MDHLLNSYLVSKRLHTIDSSKPRSEVIEDLAWIATKLREIDVDEDITEKINETLDRKLTRH